MDRETQETYAVIADDYANRWRDRTLIAGELDAFLTHVPRRGRIIDLGCGPGFDGQLLAKAGHFVMGCDLSPAMLLAGRARDVTIPLAVADMRRLPLPDRSLDGIWLNAALLHLPRAEAPTAVGECARVLRPAGLLYVAVKAGEGEEHTTHAYGHRRRRFFTYWPAATLDALLEAAGFTILTRRQSDIWLSRLTRLGH